ncbi:alanine racemase [Sulfobacillus harzensis]|uniref:Alanine racemase n=1 Tax=Sulfobacillus harzensis TaxID=2729629 RepID=A0A7Y0L4S2_9FIRM|nr:alanine racemase [Sulfobacillus harzensis]NMP23215.1 alanine racemase [Sulfobacillus harzensis]
MARAHLRHTVVEINLEAIRANIAHFCDWVGDQVNVMAVVKADAYGHGAVEVARAALKGGAAWLGVAQAEEGVELREAHLDCPILVLGPSNPEQARLAVAHHLDLMVTSGPGWASVLEAAQGGKRPRVHLKVDTGMGRVGVRPDTVVSEWLPRLTSGKVQWQGLMSHLAASDEPDPESTQRQLAVFLDVLEAVRAKGVAFPPALHLANSAAALRYPGTHFNLVRVGIGMYGALDLEGASELEPAMTISSAVSLVKRVPAGTPIGYGGSFVTNADATIATVPIGYADGYRRAFSNRAEALVSGVRCPVVGRVSMDQITILVPDGIPVEEGDRVVLLGRMGDQHITIHDWADWADTISYEILTGISTRMTRRYSGAQLE